MKVLSKETIFKEAPGVIPFLPMLYVAWADAVLTPSELKILRTKVKEQKWLTAKERSLLLERLDPKNPPSDVQLRSWVNWIRNAAAEMPDEEKKTLADLGLMVAKKNIKGDQSRWSSASTKAALSELEKALDVVSLEVHSNILTQRTSDQGGHKTDDTAFQLTEMQLLLDGHLKEVRDKTKMIITDDLLKYQPVSSKELYRDKVMSWCKIMAEQGFGAMAYPKEVGGGGDMDSFIAMFETLGYHDMSMVIKFGVQFGLFGGSIQNLGTEYHHKKYMAQIGKLELPGCFAMTETGHGSNVNNIETTATYDPKTQEFVVHSPSKTAGKEYIGNALHGEMATVFAQLIVAGESQGVHAVMVPLKDKKGVYFKGITVEDCGYKMGLNGVDNGRIWFDNVRVPRENLLNRFGDVSPEGKYTSPIKSESKRFFTMLGTLVGGRVNVPLAGLSASKVGLTIAIRYALKRRQFGPDNGPETLLLDYPTHQRRLMPHLATTYGLHFALRYLAKRYVDRKEEDMREIETLAAGMKAYATWKTTEILQECREACGGKGYLEENRFTALKADTDIFTTFEGDNTVLMQLVAKGLLTEYKHEFGSAGAFGVLRYLAEQVTTTATELNPVFGRQSDQDHLRDPAFHLHALRYRERKLLVQLANRMREKLKRGMPVYDSFLRVQNHFLVLANAFVERVVLEQFLLAIKDCKNEGLKGILYQLESLFALHAIEKDKGWFLETGYLEPAKSKAIRRQVDKLCLETRLQAGDLVSAFDIPEACLAAPIVVKKR